MVQMLVHYQHAQEINNYRSPLPFLPQPGRSIGGAERALAIILHSDIHTRPLSLVHF